MRFAVAVFACAFAFANAQYQPLSQFDFLNRQNQGQYRPGQYNRFQQLNRFNQPIKPYVTPAPVRAVASVSVTPAPVVKPVPAQLVNSARIPVPKVVSDARSAEIVRSGNDINPDGSFNYFFETNNGIAAQAQGTPRNFGGNPPVIPDVIQGAFSWTSPEGVPIDITYVADENGYQPKGDALPVPPPVPAQILRALEYTAKYRRQ